jgi:hypothetical protein
MNASNRPSVKDIAERIRASRPQAIVPASPPGKVAKAAAPAGYVRGTTAAAAYCNVDRKTFRSWRDDNTQSDQLRKLLQPRIIRGESYYKIANIDRFMDPVNNAPDEETRGRHLLAA